MSIFKRSSNRSSNPTKSLIGRSSLLSSPRFSLRQYGFVGVSLLLLAGGIVLFAATPNVTGSSTIIGLNGEDGFGSNAAAIAEKYGINDDRVQWTYPNATADYGGTPSQDATYGITNHVAILNIDDGTALSSVSPTSYGSWALGVIQANPQIKLWEVVNEAYYKGCQTINNNYYCVADPASYGALYVATYNAVQAANGGGGISGITLLFNTFGDYCNTGGKLVTTSCPTWSQDAEGGGWLHDAVQANPALKTDIEALSTHPYGGVGDFAADETGTCAVGGITYDPSCAAVDTAPWNGWSAGPCTAATGCSQEVVAKAYLGRIPPIYITEFGIPWNGVGITGAETSDAGYNTPCTTSSTVSTQQALYQGQAYLLTEAYDVFMKDPNIKGIWYYELEDLANDGGPDNAGDWGLINGNGSTTQNSNGTIPVSPRPALSALYQFEDYNSSNPPTPTCTPPSLPSGVSPTVGISTPSSGATASGTTTIAASASENGGTIASVQFQLDGKNLGSPVTTPTSGSTYSYSWNTATVSNGTHTLTAVATDSTGSSTTSSSVSVTVSNAAAPPSVQNFTWNASTKSLTWSAYPGATNYLVAIIQNPTTTRTPVTYPFPPTTGTSYTPASFSGQAVNYGILPETNTGPNQYAGVPGSTWAAEVTVHWPDVTPPSVPTNLAASAASSSQVNLSWTASTDNVSVTGYTIYRGTPGTAPTKLTTIPAGTSSTITFGDSGLQPSTTYTYTVSAFDAADNQSAQSSSASVATNASSSTTTVEGVVTNSGSGAPVAGASVHTGNYGSKDCAPPAKTCAATATTNSSGQYVLINITPSKTHDYYYKANDYKSTSFAKNYPAGIFTKNVSLVP
jgi:Big-like domain-containing protein/fibronectin type III domain protein